MRILVVEDDADLSRQLKDALKDVGYAVDVANDGEEGHHLGCLLYTSPSPRDQRGSRMPSSA